MTLAVVLGRAEGVFSELEDASALRSPDVVVAANVVGVEYSGPIHHWVSWHAELFPLWLKHRRHRGYPEPGRLWTATFKGHPMGSGLRLPLSRVPSTGGSTGLLAVQVALLHAARVILCGVPMDASPRFDDPTAWAEASAHRQAWNEALPQLQDRVRSMSGWTRSLLGAPSRQWLEEGLR